ncbi:MAG: hypothetical protein AB1778_10425 [Candidatus Bipolaricaulota bacterium]
MAGEVAYLGGVPRGFAQLMPAEAAPRRFVSPSPPGAGVGRSSTGDGWAFALSGDRWADEMARRVPDC